MDSYDGEPSHSFQHFSRSTTFAYFCTAQIQIFRRSVTIFVFLNENGFEVVESEAISGGMAIVAFFAVRLIRNILPILVSSLMGALGLMSATLLLSSEPLTLLSPSNSSTVLMICVLFLLSFTWQYTDIRKKKKKAQNDANPDIPEMQHVARGNQVQARHRRAGDLPDLRDFS